MLPYPVLEYGDYGKRKTICCLHLRRKGLHGNGFRAYGKGLAVKINACEKYVKSLGATAVEYIGIAADESGRVKEKCYPLVEWGWTEYQCLQYCYAKGYNWLEGGIELYSILDRVSCWCCRNKNLRELNAIYHNLPQYWDKLRALQSYIEEPYKPPYTIFDLEERFAKKGRQRGLWEV